MSAARPRSRAWRTSIKLSANEAALGPSPKAIAALRAALPVVHRYPDGGARALRQAIGARFDLDPERIVCGAGSDELIQLLMRAYAGPGDEVLYSAHGFLMYRLSALAIGATPVAAPERELRADVDALLARVTSRTRARLRRQSQQPDRQLPDRRRACAPACRACPTTCCW